ncbi:hypothetical protein TeGR_g8466 [Tetraparma gracilis]|uniref:Uncharacterized protein n=1 Tax=Tetraparma gracilis TaxID=2962635 RepID=A0ABQ6N5P7_9STRA|nr:hypothetical protein TeGR_g8466 [Tetraparma gracilis]
MSLTDLSDIDLEETEDFATVSKILGSQGSVFGEELDAETAESLLDALLRMTSTAPRAELGGEAWGPVAACAAEFSPGEPQVVEVALGILAKVSGSCQGKLDEAFVALLKRVMDENGDDEPTIQEQCCLVVKGLAEGNEGGGGMMLGQGIEAALDEALGKIQNERNKKYVAEAKAALGL